MATRTKNSVVLTCWPFPGPEHIDPTAAVVPLSNDIGSWSTVIPVVLEHRLRSPNGRGVEDQAGLGSFGRPRTRSLTMLRWIWLVPPQIVSEREKKNADIIGDTG